MYSRVAVALLKSFELACQAFATKGRDFFTRNFPRESNQIFGARVEARGDLAHGGDPTGVGQPAS